MEAERFLLKWNNHQSNLVTVFDQLYEQEAFTDVTLACDGRSFAAHKVILSACSPYFQQLFLSNPCKHPIIFMRDVRAGDLDALLAFMYRGEINVHQHDLASFLKTAESLQIKGLSDSSDKPRDTSKILEAMERKFSSNYVNSASSIPASSTVTSNANFSLGIGNIFGSPICRTSPISSVLPNMAGLNRPLSHAISSSDHTPPPKKLKTVEDLPKILPKAEDLPRILPKMNATQSLGSPVPGLLTPITLAAAVMKSLPQNPATPPCPSTPEMNNSPNADAAISNDSKEGPHPLFLVSNVGTGGGGGGGLGNLNSSGNSTPSQDVKIEEEDPLDENNFSDDPSSSGPQDLYESTLDPSREAMTLFYSKDKMDPSYMVQIHLDPSTFTPQKQEALESVIKKEESVFESDTKILGQKGQICGEAPGPEARGPSFPQPSSAAPIHEDATGAGPESRRPYPKKREINLVNSVMNKMDELGEDLQRNPEFLSCLRQEVRSKFCQEDLERERPIQFVGLKDHTYIVPKNRGKTQERSQGFQCCYCMKVFPPHRKHRYITHLRVHTGERPFKCSVCGKGFTRQDHVTIHKRIHGEEKALRCQVCGEEFSHKDSLAIHKCQT